MAGRRMKSGMRRQWVRCRECGWVGYYDYTPYSLSSPVMTLGCGHGTTIRFSEAVEYITATDARRK